MKRALCLLGGGAMGSLFGGLLADQAADHRVIFLSLAGLDGFLPRKIEWRLAG